MKYFFQALKIVFLIVMILFTFFPLYWAFLVSVTPSNVLFIEKPIFPKFLSFDNFVNLFKGKWGPGERMNFLLPMKNSFIVAITNTLLSIMIGTLASFALVFGKIKYKKILSVFILFAYVFPPFILMVAYRSMVLSLRLNDTLSGLVLLQSVITVPYVIWMLRSYFSTVPRELFEAALVDGCSVSKALAYIILPSTIPGVVTAATFAFTLSWQDLLLAIITIDSPEKYTVPWALMSMIQGDLINWGTLMAGAIVGGLPVIIIYYLLQKYIVSGLTAGSVKG